MCPQYSSGTGSLGLEQKNNSSAIDATEYNTTGNAGFELLKTYSFTPSYTGYCDGLSFTADAKIDTDGGFNSGSYKLNITDGVTTIEAFASSVGAVYTATGGATTVSFANLALNFVSGTAYSVKLYAYADLSDGTYNTAYIKNIQKTTGCLLPFKITSVSSGWS